MSGIARPRSPERGKARELWEADKTRTLVSIAEELGLPESRIRKWKCEDKWEQPGKGTLRNAKRERSVSKKTDAKLVAMVEENEELTDKQRAFCLHYVKSFNATRSYQKAYGSSYETAMTEGWKALQNPKISDEIKRMKAVRNQAMMMDAEDIVALHWRIAFSSMDDFVEWGRTEVPVITKSGLVEIENPETGEKETMMHKVNDVRFRESAEVDGQIVQEVKLGKDGASIKLSDRQKSLAFLERYFEMNPMDKHKKAYEQARLEMERAKSGAGEDQGKVEIIDDVPDC